MAPGWYHTSMEISHLNQIPELAAMLKGHVGVMFSLVVGANRLYSGSSDSATRVRFLPGDLFS